MSIIETNTPPQPQKKSNKKIIGIIILVAIIFMCILIACVGFLLLPSDEITDPDDPNNDPETINQIPVTEYLGYQEQDLVITNNEDLSYAISDFYYQFSDLTYDQANMLMAAEAEDPDLFFDSYKFYNKTASTLISESQAIYEYLEGDGTADSESPVGHFLEDNLIMKVQAKERFSYWYYVPVIGSLVKAKHQSIETSRSGIYDYLKNEVETVDQQAFLDEYGLKSVEDIRTATDTQVEKLARDPELRTGIDWTKVATDLGEHAVVATTDSYKLGTSNNPATSVVTGGAFRYFTKPGTSVVDEMPNVETQQTILISGSLAGQIDSSVGDNFGMKWSQVDPKIKNLLTENIISASKGEDVMIVASIPTDQSDPIEISAGDWQSLTASDGVTPVSTDIIIEAEKTTNVTIPIEDVSTNLLNPEIAANLGFDTEVKVVDAVAEECLDTTVESDDYDINQCHNNFDDCSANPYTMEDEYFTCISDNGGCWDIGRWEYATEANCPIDSSLTLDYSDGMLQSDFEYFGDGNRAYCECIVTCRVDYWVAKDCKSGLQSCCENL